MTSSHNHKAAAKGAGVVGTNPAGTVDADLDALADRVDDLEAKVAYLEGFIGSELPPPTPTGPWFGGADPWAGKPFGSLPLAPAGQMWLPSGDLGGRTFGGFKFVNRPDHVNVIVAENSWNFRLDLIDFDNVPEGIYLFNCDNYEISRIRAMNGGIYGPFTRDGFHSGNLIQTIDSGAANIHDLLVRQPANWWAAPVLPKATNPGTGQQVPSYGTEDIISIGGSPTNTATILIERADLDGGTWNSWSGTGSLLGDGDSGHKVTYRDVILTNPGQVGIGTGKNGSYTFERVRIKATRPDSNDAIQLRSPATFKDVLVDWKGVNSPPVLSLNGKVTDLGGNDWSADL